MSEKCVKSVSVEYLERLKQEMSEAKPSIIHSSPPRSRGVDMDR